MRLFVSQNTCSMGEVGLLTGIEYVQEGTQMVERSRNLIEELGKVIADARLAHRKFLVANLSQGQYKFKPLMTALKAKKFKLVGKYYGNSHCNVYVFARGLK